MSAPRHDDVLEGSILGQSFKLTGRESLYLLITCGSLTVACYLLYDNTKHMKTDLLEQAHSVEKQHTILSTEHQSLLHEMHDLNDTLQEQNYIITLSDDQRKNLRLAMPHSLREKVDRHTP